MEDNAFIIKLNEAFPHNLSKFSMVDWSLMNFFIEQAISINFRENQHPQKAEEGQHKKRLKIRLRYQKQPQKVYTVVYTICQTGTQAVQNYSRAEASNHSSDWQMVNCNESQARKNRLSSYNWRSENTPQIPINSSNKVALLVSVECSINKTSIMSFDIYSSNYPSISFVNCHFLS